MAGGAQLIKLDEAGACMDCVTTETTYACATCKRHLCTGCARDQRGCPYCTDERDREPVGSVT